MSNFIFIRHGVTPGNTLKRYIGRTDEELSESGRSQLKRTTERGVYGCPNLVFVSPMKRCLQTAELIYPGKPMHIVEDFRECDFGRFENKNYLELNRDSDYQKWVESNGAMPFPMGEDPVLFRERCCKAYAETVNQIHYDISNHCNLSVADKEYNTDITAAFIVHGGTIMSIFERYEKSGRLFYDWQINNGCGYLVESEGDLNFQLLRVLDITEETDGGSF